MAARGDHALRFHVRPATGSPATNSAITGAMAFGFTPCFWPGSSRTVSLLAGFAAPGQSLGERNGEGSEVQVPPQPTTVGDGTKGRVKLLSVDGSLTGDLARWLASTDLRPAVVPAPLVGLIDAIAAARPEELSRNDAVPDTPAERQAAVLILIATDRADGPDVLLQQRASKLRDHAGEVAFPGGAREDADAGPPATAIREAAEETGVDPAAVQPLILLPRLHIPPSRFDVTGVLAHWRTPSPVSAIDPGETDRVMRIPFTALADPENRIMLSTRFGWQGPAFVLDRAVVWGYTGEILAALLRLGGWERPWVPSNPVDLDQAWRHAG